MAWTHLARFRDEEKEAPKVRKQGGKKTDAVPPKRPRGIDPDAPIPELGAVSVMGAGDPADRAEDVAHPTLSQVFRPKWTLREDESITSNGHSAEKFFLGCVPEYDRYYCRQLDDDRLLTCISLTNCADLAHTNDLRRRFLEQRKELREAEAGLISLEGKLDKSEEVVSERNEEEAQLRKEIKDLKKKLEGSEAGELESLREENANLKVKLKETEAFAGTQLVEIYRMACEDFMEAIVRVHPDLKIEHLIPDPTAPTSEQGVVDKPERGAADDDGGVP